MTEFDDILANPLATAVYVYISLAFIALYAGAFWVLRRPRAADRALADPNVAMRRA